MILVPQPTVATLRRKLDKAAIAHKEACELHTAAGARYTASECSAREVVMLTYDAMNRAHNALYEALMRPDNE